MNTPVASPSLTERGRALCAALTALFLVLAGALVASPATADDEPSGPSIVVSKTTGLHPNGETITVTGTGFVADAPATDATRAPVGAGNFGGVYVVFGKWSDDWAPSEDGARPGSGNLSQRWGVHEAQFGGSINAGNGGFIIPEDGSFELSFTVADSSLLEGNYGIYSYAGGGAVYALFESFTPLVFATETDPGETGDGDTEDTDPAEGEPGETDDTEPTTPATPSGGSLRWAISADFTNYVIGPIAKGEIVVSGGATRAGGQFQFGQASASGYNVESGLGTIVYAGTVRYSGHSGGLDVTVSNPRIVISSASTATIFFTYDGASVAFATLNLAAATKSTSGGAVTYTAVPTSLTTDGRELVLGGFNTTLSPLTFTIGSTAPAPAGSTGTVAKASTTPKSEELPTTPPALTGIDIDEAELAALASGEQASFEASGFQPNEQDIKVVVYSTPELLGTVTADAQGIARWTGALPAGLAEGEHTLTLQGSVMRGLAFTLNRVTSTSVIGECVATDATLTWGFKETFRVYLEGIAKGGWELDDIRYDYPHFGWSEGTGSYSASTRAGLVEFGGSLRFHGHDGALDTTLKNARIEVTGDTGYLLFDVSGQTQGGADIDAKNVRFAEFSLAGVSAVEGMLTLNQVPAVLTAAGAEAFGTYPAGESLDPISAVIPVGADCVATEGPIPAPEITDENSTPLWPWVTGGIVLAALIAAGAGLAMTRRRRVEASL